MLFQNNINTEEKKGIQAWRKGIPLPCLFSETPPLSPCIVPVMRLLADRAGWHQLPFILPAGYTTIGISRYTQPYNQPASQPARQIGTSAAAAAAHGKDTADRRLRRQRHCFHQPPAIKSMLGCFSGCTRCAALIWPCCAPSTLVCMMQAAQWPLSVLVFFFFFIRSRVGSRASRTQD